MLLKAQIDKLKYKKAMFFSILIISIICIVGNLLVEHFLQKQEIEKNIKIAKTITNSILNIESQLEKTLLSSIVIIEDELLKNTVPQMDFMQKLKNKAGVDSIFIYDTNGKAYFSTTGSLDNKKFQDYYKDVPTLFERDDYYKEIKKENSKIIILPMFIIPKGGNFAFKQAMLWNKKLNYFIEVKISNENIRNLLNDNIKIHNEINSFQIWTPSGNLLISTNQQTNQDKHISIPPINEYIKNQIISIHDNIHIMFSFGDILSSKRLNSYGLTKDNNDYFFKITIK